MNRATSQNPWVVWTIETLQGSNICADFVGTNGFRQRANLSARLRIDSFSRIAPGISVRKFRNPASSFSRSLTAAAGSDCLDA